MSIAVVCICSACSASPGVESSGEDGGLDDRMPFVTPVIVVERNIGGRVMTNAYMQVFDSVRLAKATVLIVASCEWM